MLLKQAPEDFAVREIPVLSLTPKGSFLIFKLRKRLWNTEAAVNEVARRLHVPRRFIAYSGLKDKNAVTEQFISVKGASKEKVSSLRIKDLSLEYVGRSAKPLSLGSHWGNYFEVVVRNASKPELTNTFTNYYGSQRFSERNALIGKCLVKKDFSKACELLCLNHRGDPLKALKNIPLKTATLYVHAYQSLLWNKAVKALLEKGSRPKEVPVIGFATVFKDEEVKLVYGEILGEESLSLSDFVVKQWPGLSQEGGMRRVEAKAYSLRVEQLSPSSFKVCFALEKGCYATVFLEQLFSTR